MMEQKIFQDLVLVVILQRMMHWLLDLDNFSLDDQAVHIDNMTSSSLLFFSKSIFFVSTFFVLLLIFFNENDAPDRRDVFSCEILMGILALLLDEEVFDN